MTTKKKIELRLFKDRGAWMLKQSRWTKGEDRSSGWRMAVADPIDHWLDHFGIRRNHKRGTPSWRIHGRTPKYKLKCFAEALNNATPDHVTVIISPEIAVAKDRKKVPKKPESKKPESKKPESKKVAGKRDRFKPKPGDSVALAELKSKLINVEDERGQVLMRLDYLNKSAAELEHGIRTLQDHA